MPPSRPYDALYDPLYMASDSREYQISEAIGKSRRYERLPRFSNFFSELPTHPSHSIRLREAHTLPEAVLAHLPKSPTRSSTSPRRLMKVQSEGSRTQEQDKFVNGERSWPRANSAKKPSPTIYSPTRSRKGLKSPPRAIPAQQLSNGLDSTGYKVNDSVLSERTRSKQDFESTLPSLSDSKNLSLRKEMLEAWEKAEWAAREAQIQALQEEQLEAFQAEMVAQDVMAEQKISQRLLSRQRSSGSSGRNGPTKGHGQWPYSHSAPLSKGRSGGSRGSKGPKLTPLEDFVQSNMPLQGRSLFKRASVTPDLQPGAQLDKSQSATEAVFQGSAAQHGSADIGAYRPRGGRTSDRKDMAYAQHLDNVHRALLEEKAAAARQDAISGARPSPEVATPQDPQPPGSAALPDITGDAAAAQVLVLDSRGSTAEGWLSAPDIARDWDMDFAEPAAASALVEGIEQIQTPLLPYEAEAHLPGSLTPAVDLSTENARTEGVAVEEAAPTEDIAVEEPGIEGTADTAAEGEGPPEITGDINSILESLVEHAAGSVVPPDGAADETSAAGIEVPDAEEAALAVEATAEYNEELDHDLGHSEALLAEEHGAKEEAAAMLSEEAAAAEEAPVTEETQAELAVMKVTSAEGASPADVKAAILAHRDGAGDRPATAVTAILESLLEEAAVDLPAEQDGSSAFSSIEAAAVEEIFVRAEAGAPTLDMFISARHSESIVAVADVQSLALPELDAYAAAPVRPATAVSQTVDELVVEVQAHFTSVPGSAAAVADVQGAEDQIMISPAHTAQEAFGALQIQPVEASAHEASLAAAAQIAVGGQEDAPSAQDMRDINPAPSDKPEAPIEGLINALVSSELEQQAAQINSKEEGKAVQNEYASFGQEKSLPVDADEDVWRLHLPTSMTDTEAGIAAEEPTSVHQKYVADEAGAARSDAAVPVHSLEAAVAECIEGLMEHAILES